MSVLARGEVERTPTRMNPKHGGQTSETMIPRKLNEGRSPLQTIVKTAAALRLRFFIRL